ncbi:GntR family transcriptional regulator [Bogoriella caseilytica]|uniref:GntR family transcriptional regulator n=1 Tax=Bogoriella caseilytica TaxID=56055 RepID=A0A3N2BFY3_9MICO|nr:GntR family transcriptional regulator [Bogoriella caseilytica]ROR74162.1 GntR family transcriptional regulator [Bogoriella caseilytica]
MSATDPARMAPQPSPHSAPEAAGLAARRSLRDQVYDAVLDMLVAGRFGPGESLGIDPLAALLGVSPTPVREALVQLEATGLVTRTALRGYKVAPPMSRTTIEQLFDARLVVEVAAARHAAENHDGLEPALRAAVDRHRQHAAALTPPTAEASVQDLSEYLAADRAFHDLLFQATQNPFFQEMTRHISIHGERLRQFIAHRTPDAEQAVAEHEAVLEAIVGGDADQAAAAMESHILGVRQRTLLDAEAPGE